MKAWIRAICSPVIVNIGCCSADAKGGDPQDEDRYPLLWALVAAILGGVASGATEKAAAVLVGG